MKFDTQLIRCSAIGSIMMNDKSGRSMGETAKSYLQSIYKELVFGVERDIINKYIQKGLMAEDSAIALLSSVNNELYLKNDEQKLNDFICGTCDIYTGSEIRDIKSSWNIDTFPMFDTELKNKSYYYQMQGYLWLWDCKVGYVDYVLIDTPQQLIEDEKRRVGWKMGLIDYDTNEDYIAACEIIDKTHTFSQVPDDKRIKSFKVERDEDVIQQIQQRVIEARKYLQSL